MKTRVAGAAPVPPPRWTAIGPGKRRRLRMLAREWLSTRGGARPAAETLRFDAIGVTVDRAGPRCSRSSTWRGPSRVAQSGSCV